MKVCEGLDYAHNKRDNGRELALVHRDVSPQNILLSWDGDVKLSDFGIALCMQREEQTAEGVVKGKLPYMAPEQHSARPLDCRADLFAVGALLWEMLTGEILLSDAKGRGRGLRVMEGNAPPPSELRPDVPAALDAVVLRCLQPRPEARYPSAAALADALAEVMGGRRVDTTEVAHMVEEVSRNHDQPTPRLAVQFSALRPLPPDGSPPHPIDSGPVVLPDEQPPPRLDAVVPEALELAPITEQAADEQPVPSTRETARRRRTLVPLAAAIGLALAGLLALVAQSHRPSPSPPPARGAGVTAATASVPHGSPLPLEPSTPIATPATPAADTKRAAAVRPPVHKRAPRHRASASN